MMRHEDMIEEQTLLEISNDLTTLQMMEGTRWSVEPGGQTTICTWLPTDTIEIRLVEPDSAWPYELRHGSETARAMRLFKNRKLKKSKQR